MAFHIDKQFALQRCSGSETSSSGMGLDSFQSSGSWLRGRKGHDCETTSLGAPQPICYSRFRRDKDFTFDRWTNNERRTRSSLVRPLDDCKSCAIIQVQQDCKGSSLMLEKVPYSQDRMDACLASGDSVDTLAALPLKSMTGNVVQSSLSSSTNVPNLPNIVNSIKTSANLFEKFNNEALSDVTNAPAVFLSDSIIKDFPQTGNYGWALSDEEGGSKLFSTTEFADFKSDSEEQRAPSPSMQSISSIASTQRLEWDSGADIGYGGMNSMFGLSTLERMAIGSYCCAFKQLEHFGDSVLRKNKANSLVPTTVNDHCIMPADTKKRDTSNDAVGQDTANTKVMKCISLSERSEEAESQVQEYQCQLDLKNNVESSSLLLEKQACPIESENYARKSDRNTRIMMALNITEKRSSSMTDLSDIDGRRKCYWDKLKRNHSYSASDMSPVAKPMIISGSTSTCSAISQNSSNTVVGMALRSDVSVMPTSASLCRNYLGDSQVNSPNYHEQSTVLRSYPTRMTTIPKMLKNPMSNTLEHLYDKGIISNVSTAETKMIYEEAENRETEVTRFVKTFLNDLCWNASGARKQRLLKKILLDLEISLHTDENADNFRVNRRVECGVNELYNDSSTQDVTFRRISDDEVPVTQLKPCRTPNCDHLLFSPMDDVGDSRTAFCVQQNSVTGNKNTEILASSAECPFLSSSERDSLAFWSEIQQLKDAVSITSTLSVESSETPSDDLFHHQSSIAYSGIHEVLMDGRDFSELEQMQIAQPGNMQLVKESVEIKRQCNIQRLQEDILWLKRIEALLHSEKLNQENNSSQNPNFVDFPVMTTPPIVRRKFTRSQYCKQNHSIKYTISEGHLPRPVAWFLPLNDNKVGELCANSKEPRSDLKQVNGFLDKAPPWERKKSKRVFPKGFQQFIPCSILHLINGQGLNRADKIDRMDPSVSNNTDAGPTQTKNGFRKYTVPISLSSQHHNPRNRHFSHNEMRAQTEKVYKVLPEVTFKNELKQREDAYKTNRLMAYMYRKNLQQKVLARNVSLFTTGNWQC